jgi:hypothetical protein
MNWLRRFHGGCVFLITLTVGLVKMAFGLLLIAACVWAMLMGFTHPLLLAPLGLFAVTGFILTVMGLGEIVGPPVPRTGGGVRLETRRSLHRDGMLGPR